MGGVRCKSLIWRGGNHNYWGFLPDGFQKGAARRMLRLQPHCSKLRATRRGVARTRSSCSRSSSGSSSGSAAGSPESSTPRGEIGQEGGKVGRKEDRVTEKHTRLSDKKRRRIADGIVQEGDDEEFLEQQPSDVETSDDDN